MSITRPLGALMTYVDFPAKEECIFMVERDVPQLGKTYFPFEKNYDGVPVLLFSRNHYWLGPAFASLYLIFVWVGTKHMATRKAWDLRTPLKYWNLFLALFSVWGAFRIIPHIFLILRVIGWQTSLCTPPVYSYGRGGVGLWTMLFIYSKFFELIDTVFIVLRKRKLMFLHWYHHVTVLLYTWDAFVTEQPPGIYYCGMNFFVHSIMYSYYYLAAAMKKPPKWGIIVTILQLAQMVVGVVICINSIVNLYRYDFLYESNREIAADAPKYGKCFLSKGNVVAAALMYSSYLYLFAAFFVNRYANKKSKSALAKKSD